MKRTIAPTILAALLAACASTPFKLEPGSYQFTSYDAGGAKVAGPTPVNIPFNDQNFAVGAMCGNEKAASIVATRANGESAATFPCARSGK